MKNLIKYFTLLAMLIVVISCQPKTTPCPECPERHPNGYYTAAPNDTLTTTQFNTMKTAWDSNYRSYMATDSLHYFDMPLADLTSVLSHNKTALNDGVRIYMGMKNDPSGVLRPHLMILGTRSGQSDFSLIMDYTNACPAQCPQN